MSKINTAFKLGMYTIKSPMVLKTPWWQTRWRAGYLDFVFNLIVSTKKEDITNLLAPLY